MADNLTRLLVQMQGWAALLEANWPEITQWMDDLQNGHPKAQDFEPTGQGGSDPTSVNGIRPDMAAEDRKGIEADVRRAWKALDSAIHRANRYRNGERPKRQPDDAQDVWCSLHLELDAHEPRYRNELCRACATRKYQTGDFPSLDDVRQHIRTGRWPRKLVDPKQPPNMRIAGLTRLQLGTEALPDPTDRKAV